MAIEQLAAQSAASVPRPPVVAEAAARQAANADNGAANGANPAASGEQELSFWDVLDIVNPLQHIPIVNSIYRAVTGDEIKPAMQITGDVLFGGVIGGIASVANAMLEETSGKSLTGHVMATLGFDDAPTAKGAATAVAQAPTQPQAQPQPTAAQGTAPTARIANNNSNNNAQAANANRPSAAQAMAQAMPQTATPAQPPLPAGVPPQLAAAARGGQPQGANPNDVMRSGHIPAKMPARDVMLTTNMPRDNRGANLERPPASSRTGAVLPPAVGALRPATAAANNSATPNNAAPAPSAGAPPANATVTDPMADVMLRNLAKYQASKRPPAPTMRTSG